jgi:hypothetical protein
MRVLLLAFSTMLAMTSVARAFPVLCEGSYSTASSAFPASGATDVSPMTSVVLVSSTRTPTGLTVQVGGQAVDFPNLTFLGHGLAKDGSAFFWYLNGSLSPSTTYVLSDQESGVTHALTRFTTAATYDQVAGQAPVLNGLHLWHVNPQQGPPDTCAFSDYDGYIDLDYQDGSMPGTPGEELVNVLSLRDQADNSPQTFVFAGVGHFQGVQIEDAWVDLSDGGLPWLALGMWQPSLKLDHQYCATLTLYGRNNLAIPTVVSNTVCSGVVSIDATTPPSDAGAPDSRFEDGRDDDAESPLATPDSFVGTDDLPTQPEPGMGGSLGTTGVGGNPSPAGGTGGTTSLPWGKPDADASTLRTIRHGCSCELAAPSATSPWILLSLAALLLLRLGRGAGRSE